MCGALLLLSGRAAAAEPLDLFDSRPREIAVSFEVSPREQPARTQAVFSRDFRAFVEPGLRPSELRVVIPAQTVEAHLLGDQNPIPQSFSDFVWTFDSETGHVVSARMRGRVEPVLDWGFMKTRTHAEIHVEMGTTGLGGFNRPRHVLGNLVFRYCAALDDPNCQLVEASPYDSQTGYVNAVGQVWVHSPVLDVWNFSPLGEAVFRELDSAGRGFEAAASGIASSLPAAVEPLPVVSNSAPRTRGALDEIDAALH